MKNKVIILVLFIISSINLVAQTTYKGKVVDAKNNEVVGASIVSTANNNKGTVTDFKGNFTINLDDSSVKISMIGFKTRIVKLSNAFNNVLLQESTEKLDEVIISASREIQKRSEVPAAISVITAQKINEIKPVGIEQITNQVPGVFVSSSKAGSNEQHFTATRSPITTRPLFLFLEDGLPLRPVAVFNHNALLETNSTSFGRVEVLKGPASSIYGSEAIGGSFNFITKDPTKELSGSLSNQTNTLGFRRYEGEISGTVNEKHGFYLGGHYAGRRNGPFGHSDYDKYAFTFKNVNKFTESLTWTNVITYVDFETDTTGSVPEDEVLAGELDSNETFTSRIAKSLRIRSTLDKQWNTNNKTAFNLIYRDNLLDQIPTFRIRIPNGSDTGSGEINSNTFESYVGLIQHKVNFNFLNSSLIVGASADLTQQDFVAETTTVTVNPVTRENSSFVTNEGDFILNYAADLFNYAGYTQFEISPIEKLKVTAALRYDGFTYDYDNLVEDLVGVADTKVDYDNFSPKLGFNYNLSNEVGFYANYSKGFTPPQTSDLFRNGDNDTAGNAVFDLDPAIFNNYEVGGYYTIPNKLKIDLALYQLDGRDRLVSFRDDEGLIVQANAGETQSLGVELGIKYNFLPNLWVTYSGTFASHRFIEFIEDDVDLSNTSQDVAPKYIANTTLNYKPLKILLLTLEHEQIGSYNTSFEGQAVIGTDAAGEDILGTATYDGHDIFNFRANLTLKKFEVWTQFLNIFDKIYATRATYNTFSNENRFTVGNPLAVHFGVKYNF